MQRRVFGLRAVEQQERIDEDWKVGHDGDVECTVLAHSLRVDIEPIAEEHPRGVCPPPATPVNCHDAKYHRTRCTELPLCEPKDIRTRRPSAPEPSGKAQPDRGARVGERPEPATSGDFWSAPPWSAGPEWRPGPARGGRHRQTPDRVSGHAGMVHGPGLSFRARGDSLTVGGEV